MGIDAARRVRDIASKYNVKETLESYLIVKRLDMAAYLFGNPDHVWFPWRDER